MTFTPIGQTERIRTPESQSADGRKHGETGSMIASSSSSEIAAFLSKHNPSDLDRMAVSRASSHNVALEVRTEGRYPTGENGEYLPSYIVAVDCRASGSDEDRQSALADLRNFLTPAPKRQIEEWLAELDAISASRKSDGFTGAVRLEAYASRLSEYPADVAKYAVLKHPWKFWPTWAELEKVCRIKAGPRRQMIRALEHPAPEPEPKRRPPTAEERQRMADLIADKFPMASQAWRDAALNEASRGNCMKDEGKSS